MPEYGPSLPNQCATERRSLTAGPLTARADPKRAGIGLRWTYSPTSALERIYSTIQRDRNTKNRKAPLRNSRDELGHEHLVRDAAYAPS